MVILWLGCDDEGVRWILQAIIGDAEQAPYMDPKLDDIMEVYRKEKLIRTLTGGPTR